MVKTARWTLLCLLVVLAFTVVLAVTPATVQGQQPQEAVSCNEQEGVEICVKQFSIAENVVTKGDDVTGVVNIENVGNTSGEVGVVIAVSNPDGSTTYHHLTRSSLSANQTREIPLSFSSGDSTPGEHRMNVLLLDAEDDHMYDATGYSQATVIEEGSLTLGGLRTLIVTSSSALWIVVAVVLPLAGYLLGNRQFRN